MADDKGGGGGGGSDFFWILGIIALMVLMWMGASAQKQNGGQFFKPPTASFGGVPGASVPAAASRSPAPPPSFFGGQASQAPSPYASAYAGQITIGAGNAAYEADPNKEYIVLSASGNNYRPLDIGGWVLENSRGRKMNAVGQTFSADRAVIPQGVVVGTGERVIVTSGLGMSFFHVNKCSGYLDVNSARKYVPPLPRDCPLAANHPLARTFSDTCFEFLQSLPRCADPDSNYQVGLSAVFETDESDVRLSKACRNFVDDYLNYKGCVATYQNEPDFYGNEWRVALRQRYQLWADEAETITLYDSNGRIVDVLEY